MIAVTLRRRWHMATGYPSRYSSQATPEGIRCQERGAHKGNIEDIQVNALRQSPGCPCFLNWARLDRWEPWGSIPSKTRAMIL